MKLLAELLGWALFLGLAGYFFLQHGSHWEFGKFGMPHTLIAADGVHHPDGTEIDPATLAMARTGAEEETMLAALCVLALGMAYVLRQWYRVCQLDEQIRKNAGRLEALT